MHLRVYVSRRESTSKREESALTQKQTYNLLDRNSARDAQAAIVRTKTYFKKPSFKLFVSGKCKKVIKSFKNVWFFAMAF